MFEPNTHRMETCEHCGRRFMSDCGDAFCSSSCERAYEEDQKEECINCGKLFDPDDLRNGLCEWCEEYKNNRGDME